jgi:N-acetyl-gamma-glutamylphosphate reductase
MGHCPHRRCEGILGQGSSKRNLVDLSRSIITDFKSGVTGLRLKPLSYVLEMADVRGTNCCDLGLFPDSLTGLWIIISVIDNI